MAVFRGRILAALLVAAAALMDKVCQENGSTGLNVMTWMAHPYHRQVQGWPSDIDCQTSPSAEAGFEKWAADEFRERERPDRAPPARGGQGPAAGALPGRALTGRWSRDELASLPPPEERRWPFRSRSAG